MSEREIVFDTETTGLDPLRDRVVEIGAVELVNRLPTGREFHRYVNPYMHVPEEATRVHGLTNIFLSTYGGFEEIAEELVAFLGDAPLVAHNASFDAGFLNAELRRAGLAEIAPNRFVDTLAEARKANPFAPASLDALCARYGVDRETRKDGHGALVDARLLAAVWLEMRGGRQSTFDLGAPTPKSRGTGDETGPRSLVRPTPLPNRLSPDEDAAHVAFIAEMGEGAIWRQYLDPPKPSVDHVTAEVSIPAMPEPASKPPNPAPEPKPLLSRPRLLRPPRAGMPPAHHAS